MSGSRRFLNLSTLFVWHVLLLSAMPVGAVDAGFDFPGNGIPVVTDWVTSPSQTTTNISGLSTLPEAYYVTSAGKTLRFRARKKDYFLTLKEKPGGGKVKPDKIKLTLDAELGAEIEFQKDKRFRKKIRAQVKAGKDTWAALAKLRRKSDIDYISPILIDDKGKELGLSPGIVISLKQAGPIPGQLLSGFANLGLSAAQPLAFTEHEFLLHYDGLIEDPAALFKAVRAVMALPEVEWAEPNFEVVTSKNFTPDDTLFAQQWHLNNTGQNGGVPMADINAVEGWELTRGTGTVIGIVDDGVELSHPDLPIWNNPGESGDGKESDGIDNDANGYVDDFQGWDFTDSDNDPNPAAAEDNHGTAVAGMAAARGDNALGVSGSAGNALILPVRMTSGDCATFGTALRYAARYADVVSNSWSITACESAIDAAVADAVAGVIIGARRGDKGTPVLFATGNDGNVWIVFELEGVPDGTHTYEWEYSKDASGAGGDDTMWLDLVIGPGLAFLEQFDGSLSLPTGWSSSGDAFWTVVGAPDALAGNSARAGIIGNNQTTSILTTQFNFSPGTLLFAARIYSEPDDVFNFWLTINDDPPGSGTRLGPFFGAGGISGSGVAYPSSNPNTIAIGASNDGSPTGQEERSSYSQFGPNLDVLAPSSDDFAQGVTTTDRQGENGYEPGDYTSTFSGTSAATPLAAGVVADLLAIYPHLTAAQVRDALLHGADQIGPMVYTPDRNDYYGHGRVNLLGSIDWIKASGLEFNCDLNDQLVANRWALIGLPCLGLVPGTLSSVLGDDMDTILLSSDWVMGHKLNAGANNYTSLSSDSDVDPGVGYWIKSTLGDAIGGAFLDNGWLDVVGTETPVVDSINCPSDNGCFEIALNSPATGLSEEWNMVAHPLAFPVDWADVRIVVDGSLLYVPTAAEAANILSATYQVWTGNTYRPYDDNTPAMEGTLQPGEGFWVKVLPGAIGRSVVLLIPAVPSLKASALVEKEVWPWYASVISWMIPSAHAGESNPGRKADAIGYAKREARKEASHERLQAGKDWYVRLSVEAPEMQLVDAGNAFGQLFDSKQNFDSHDLQERPPFGSPYLTLVFPHDDWGKRAGDYASDFHKVKRQDKWEFEIKTDEPGRQINLCWEGDDEIVSRSWLIDLETGEQFDLSEQQQASRCLAFAMEGTSKRYRWRYRE